MSSPSQEETRAARLREYELVLDHARSVVAVMASIARGREARGRQSGEPAEVAFAAHADDDGRVLPAAVWVALRQDDRQSVLDAVTTASRTSFLISRHEELGEGYRLQPVEETRALPDVDLLLGQLSRTLNIPVDVLGVLAQWGIDDPRTGNEVDALLDSRFGAGGRGAAAGQPGELSMSVQETADVLQLTPGQLKVLATLVSRAGVRITE